MEVKEKKQMKNTNWKLALLIICLAAFAVVGVMLSGCATADVDNEHQSYIPAHFAIVEDIEVDHQHGHIIVHVETGVLYLWMNTNNYTSGITPLLNADGTPMLYEEFKK